MARSLPLSLSPLPPRALLSLSLSVLTDITLSLYLAPKKDKRLEHLVFSILNAQKILPEFGRTKALSQKEALHKAFSPSPQRRWTSLILSADLQIPLQVQSNEATQMLPA